MYNENPTDLLGGVWGMGGSEALGVPSSTKSVVFFNIVQKAVDPPPLVLNIAEQMFFDGFLKKRANVCRDKNRQNNA